MITLLADVPFDEEADPDPNSEDILYVLVDDRVCAQVYIEYPNF